MTMMASQILKSVDKTQKSRYLENETLFYLQIKKFINYTSRYFIAKNSFVAEATFKLTFRSRKFTVRLEVSYVIIS